MCVSGSTGTTWGGRTNTRRHLRGIHGGSTGHPCGLGLCGCSVRRGSTGHPCGLGLHRRGVHGFLRGRLLGLGGLLGRILGLIRLRGGLPSRLPCRWLGGLRHWLLGRILWLLGRIGRSHGVWLICHGIHLLV
ncbi:hypothetical protein J2S71_001486 [Olsenella profusa DSM 13989]|nr:hypothetical protein [Olsenella profusa DSM 13989]